MGYFNYFIKCLIRNLVNTFFRPRKLRKIFIFFLISAVVFLLFTTKSRAVEIDDYSYTVNPMYLFYNHENNPSSTFTYKCYPVSKGYSYYFSGISSTYSLFFTSNADFIQTLNYSIEGTKSYYGYLENGSTFIMVNNVNLGASSTTNYYSLQGFNISLNDDFTYTAPDDGFIYCLSTSHNFILKSNYDVTYSSLLSIHTAIDTLQLTISDEFTKLANTIIEQNNRLIGVLKGEENKTSITDFNSVNNLQIDNNIFVDGNRTFLYFSYNPNYSYKIDISNNTLYNFNFAVCYGDLAPGVGVGYVKLSEFGIPSNTSSSYTVPKSLNAKFIYVRFTGPLPNSKTPFTVTQIEGQTGLNNINDSVIQQGSQTRDTITDTNVDDISSDNLPSGSDISNPTDTGFDTIFQLVYNAFTGSSSGVSFKLPYLDYDLSIPPNFLSNTLNNAGLSFIVTIIQSFWWFAISYYIYKDINRYIDKIKSGDLTSDDGNIKTEVL